jgi:hypothetical protein
VAANKAAAMMTRFTSHSFERRYGLSNDNGEGVMSTGVAAAIEAARLRA